MARQQRFQRQNSAQGSGQLLMIVIAFVTGYMSSSIIDMTRLAQLFNQSLAKWGRNNHIAQISEQKKTPQPHLEFYTILSQKSEHRVPVGTDLQKMVKPNQVEQIQTKPAPVVVAKAIEPAAVVEKISNKGRYVVQLASFRYYSQAEKFRAQLLLKGFNVNITAIHRGSLNWYRVMLGPFVNQVEARKAQLAYQSREHSVGMIRPVEA